MTGGRWQNLPLFFRNSLVARWNDWLKTRYGSDENSALHGNSSSPERA